jgi:glycosyltransferase involved in cell wall biosynthesis
VKACLVIPCFEHGEPLRAVIASLAGFRLPAIVVDDGSGEATRAVLARLADEHPWVEVHRHAENLGKGAATATGFRLASARGATHALQLDADGQHEAADVPRFLEAMAKREEALVLGAPVFDASVPRSRLYGRQISRALVWLFTLSFDIRDPLCGFRGVPLAPALRLLDRVRLGSRMDFDPELVVRLFWEGLEVVSVPTRVRYPPGGLSHFDVVWDDLRLAGLYLRLAGGMLARAPRLVARARRTLR